MGAPSGTVTPYPSGAPAFFPWISGIPVIHFVYLCFRIFSSVL